VVIAMASGVTIATETKTTIEAIVAAALIMPATDNMVTISASVDRLVREFSKPAVTLRRSLPTVSLAACRRQLRTGDF